MAVINSNVEGAPIAIPHEDGEWVKVRRLSGDEMGIARRRSIQGSFKLFDGMDEDMILKFMQMSTGGAKTDDQNPYERYDHKTLCQLAITSWSYPEECDEINRGSLDGKTQEYIAKIVIDANTFSAGNE